MPQEYRIIVRVYKRNFWLLLNLYYLDDFFLYLNDFFLYLNDFFILFLNLGGLSALYGPIFLLFFCERFEFSAGNICNVECLPEHWHSAHLILPPRFYVEVQGAEGGSWLWRRVTYSVPGSLLSITLVHMAAALVILVLVGSTILLVIGGTGLFVLGWKVVRGVQNDVNLKFWSEVDIEEAKIARCRNDYYGNKCDMMRLPQAANFCDEKELCMNKIARVEVSMLIVFAKYLASGLNAFSDDLNYTATAVFTILAIIFILFLKTVAIPLYKIALKHIKTQ